VLIGAEVNAELLRIKEVQPHRASGSLHPPGWARRLQERVPLLHHISELAADEETSAQPAADQAPAAPTDLVPDDRSLPAAARADAPDGMRDDDAADSPAANAT